MPNHAEQLAQELNLSLKNVQGAIDLIDAGEHHPIYCPLPQRSYRRYG